MAVWLALAAACRDIGLTALPGVTAEKVRVLDGVSARWRRARAPVIKGLARPTATSAGRRRRRRGGLRGRAGSELEVKRRLSRSDCGDDADQNANPHPLLPTSIGPAGSRAIAGIYGGACSGIGRLFMGQIRDIRNEAAIKSLNLVEEGWPVDTCLAPLKTGFGPNRRCP
jgi:hypothetical protein